MLMYFLLFCRVCFHLQVSGVLDSYLIIRLFFQSAILVYIAEYFLSQIPTSKSLHVCVDPDYSTAGLPEARGC